MSTRKTVILVAAASALAAAGLVTLAGGGGPADAQAFDERASEAVFTANADPASMPGWEGVVASPGDEGEHPRLAALLAGVAERLGVSVDELVDAFRAESLEQLDEAVAAGKLTDEQAERMRTRIESEAFSIMPLPRAGQPGGHGQLGPGLRAQRLVPPAVFDSAAEALGLEREELLAKLRDGETFAEIASAQGKSAEELVSALVDEAGERLERAVDAGRLTESQMAELLERLESRLEKLVELGLPGIPR